MRYFISYRRTAGDDQRLAHVLKERLHSAGHEVFMDVDMAAGTDWSDEIDHRIAWCDALVVLLSEESVKSEMVRGEVAAAFARRRSEGQPHLLPIRVRFGERLGYALDSMLGGLQQLNWQSDGDTARVLAAILGSDATGLSPSRPQAGEQSNQPAPAAASRTATAGAGGTAVAGDIALNVGSGNISFGGFNSGRERT